MRPWYNKEINGDCLAAFMVMPQLTSFELIKQLPLDEVSWRRLLLETLPANTRALEKIEQHLALLIELVRGDYRTAATTLELGTLATGVVPVVTTPPVVGGPVITEPLVTTPPVLGGPVITEPLVTIENLVIGVLATPTVTVGSESAFELEFTDVLKKPVKFAHLSISAVDIGASQLANADDVRLRLFRQGRRRVPQDLVAEFSGSSVTSGTWHASFSNRRIEVTDESGHSKLYIAIRNKAGNSSASVFELRFNARAFPASRG